MPEWSKKRSFDFLFISKLYYIFMEYVDLMTYATGMKNYPKTRRSTYLPNRMKLAFSHVVLASLLICLASTTRAEEIKINHDGLTLNALFSLGHDASPNDRVVLIVHGTLAHNGMETIANLSDTLNERGLNTLAINLSLGINDRHGMYDCAVPHRHKHLDALGEIDAWLGWLKTKGAGPIVLFGHSRGGNQVARYAAQPGAAELEGVVLLAPATWNKKESADHYQKTYGTPLASVLAHAENQIAIDKGTEHLIDTGFLYCPGTMVTADSFVSYYHPDPHLDTPSVLKEISTSVLVLAGSEDTVVKNLASRVSFTATEKGRMFAEIDGADHFFLDLFSEDIADFVEDFLDSRES